MLAVSEAVRSGFDEALLLDAEGNIAEGSGENLFLFCDEQLLTNDERSSILLGITREAVIEIARDLGYRVSIGTLRLEDLYRSREAFFTGTAAEVTPIREIDGRPVGEGARGPVTEALQEAFFTAVRGRNPHYKHWTHLVAGLPVEVGL
jgi:branched-chain amino acid aminotransferase